MVSLGFVVVLGYILAVGFHRYRVAFPGHVSRAGGGLQRPTRSVQSLHGYDGLLYQLQTSMSHHTKSLLLAVCQR